MARIVDVLLTYLPDRRQVLLLARTIPRHLALGRLAAAGELAQGAPAQHRFTPGETGDLMRRGRVGRA